MSDERCDEIVNNGMGEPTGCGRTLPCEYHGSMPEDDFRDAVYEVREAADGGLAVLDWIIAFDWLLAHENHTLHFGRDHGGGAHIRCASPDGGYIAIAILSPPSSDRGAPDAEVYVARRTNRRLGRSDRGASR